MSDLFNDLPRGLLNDLPDSNLADQNPVTLDLRHSETLLNGDLLYFPSAFPNADALFKRLLDEVHWESGEVILFGKRHKEPRLKSWQGEPGLSYQYSGIEQTTRPLTSTTQKLRHQLNSHFDNAFNSVLCNLYRDGQDSMGWHADDEPELGMNPVIASITLGSERDFCLRQKGSTRQHGKMKLAHGSLLLMQAGMQSRWQHSVPKRTGDYGPRINLTYRHLIAR
ncbi:MAG: alpha-ketoglutarate-dependent dioxygenase AlkB family protein [Oceanobacter sp.]